MRRPRGPGGRFLSSAEMAALKATGRLNEDGTIAQPPENTTGVLSEHEIVLQKLNEEMKAAKAKEANK